MRRPRMPPFRRRPASSASISRAATTASTRSFRCRRSRVRGLPVPTRQHRAAATRAVRRRQGRHHGDAGHRQQRWRSPTRCVSGPGNNGVHAGVSTRSTAMARAAPGPTSRSSRPRTTSRPTCRTSRAAITGSRARWRQLETGWLGRWLDRLRRPRTTRCRRSRLSSDLSKSIRTASAPVCAISEPRPARASRSQVTNANANAQVANLAAVPFDRGEPRARAEPARSTARRSGLEAAQRSQPGRSGAPGYPTNSDLSDNLQLAATLLSAPGSGRASSRSTGVRSTPTATRSPPRIRNSSHPLERAGGVQGRSDQPRDRAAGSDARVSRSSAAGSRRTTRWAPITAPAAS